MRRLVERQDVVSTSACQLRRQLELGIVDHGRRRQQGLDVGQPLAGAVLVVQELHSLQSQCVHGGAILGAFQLGVQHGERIVDPAGAAQCPRLHPAQLEPSIGVDQPQRMADGTQRILEGERCDVGPCGGDESRHGALRWGGRPGREQVVGEIDDRSGRLDRVGHANVNPLTTSERKFPDQRLADLFVHEQILRLAVCGELLDQMCPLGCLQRVEQIVLIAADHRCEVGERERSPDHCS